MRAILILISVVAILAFHSTGKEPDKATAGSATTIQLNYVRVTDAHELLNTAIPQIDQVVTSVDVATNTLTLNSTATQFKKVRKILTKIDKRPQQIKIEMEITEVDAAGNVAVVSRPTVFTLAGNAAEISLGTHDGKQRKLSIKATPLPEDEQELLRKK